MIPVSRLDISKARLLDDLVRGTASELKECIYVINEDVIEEFNNDEKVKSFDLAVDRKALLERGWWLGSVEDPVREDSVDDLMIAKITIVDRPSVSDYKMEGIHADDKLSDSSFTKHAVFLSQVDTLVPVLGKFVANKISKFLREQIETARHYKYLVCSTNALLFKSVPDVREGADTFSVNMGIQFPWKVDYNKTTRYTGLCFYKI